MAGNRLCSIEGCGKRAIVRGWCRNHYDRWRRNGGPTAGGPSRRRNDGAICSVDGCANQSKFLGMCNKHYLRVKRYGDPGFSKLNRDQTGAPCSVDGCERKSGYKGMCQAHYVRQKKYGDASLTSDSYRRRLRWVEENVGFDSDDCLIWPFSVNDNGRGSVMIDRKVIPASRYMCMLAHGLPPDERMHAAHTCGMGHIGCVNPRHLRWATPKDNERDKIKHGTVRRGRDINTNKLTEEDVKAIRAAPKDHGSGRILASKYGVTPSAISAIRGGTVWKWLPK